MKVKDLIRSIEWYKQRYPDFLEWDVYTEQIDEGDKRYKKSEQGWEWVTDSEDFEYFDCAGFHTLFKDKKIFTINVNY